MVSVLTSKILHIAQATAAFVKFLHEAASFYAVLACKLQAAYGSVGVQLTFADQVCCDCRLCT